MVTHFANRPASTASRSALVSTRGKTRISATSARVTSLDQRLMPSPIGAAVPLVFAASSVPSRQISEFSPAPRMMPV